MLVEGNHLQNGSLHIRSYLQIQTTRPWMRCIVSYGMEARCFFMCRPSTHIMQKRASTLITGDFLMMQLNFSLKIFLKLNVLKEEVISKLFCSLFHFNIVFGS